MAAYRFFDNDSVDWRALMEPHWQQTQQRIESLRWIEGYERIVEMAHALPDTRLVYVADREADLMQLMALAQQLGTPADWLVRAKHNRCLSDGNQLWAHIIEGLPLGEIPFQMPARKGVKVRPVRQQLCARLCRPRVSLRAKSAQRLTPHRSNGAC